MLPCTSNARRSGHSERPREGRPGVLPTDVESSDRGDTDRPDPSRPRGCFLVQRRKPHLGTRPCRRRRRKPKPWAQRGRCSSRVPDCTGQSSTSSRRNRIRRSAGAHRSNPNPPHTGSWCKPVPRRAGSSSRMVLCHRAEPCVGAGPKCKSLPGWSALIATCDAGSANLCANAGGVVKTAKNGPT
jgi:hypothetical protein